MMNCHVVKEIQFDYGHRLQNHKSACKNMHGHRGVAHVHVSGKVVTERGESDEGMVLDFKDLKKILQEKVHDVVDHGFIVSYSDVEMIKFLRTQGSKCVVFRLPPTAEIISLWICQVVNAALKDINKDLEVYRVDFYETPSSKAIVYCTDADMEQDVVINGQKIIGEYS